MRLWILPSAASRNAPINEQAIEELGRSYALVTDGLRIKPYPCGGLTHQVIDSVLEFRAQHGLTAEMIERIDVDVVKHTFDRIVFRVPQTGIQGKFCMPYLVARAIIDGKIGLHIFTDSAVRDQNVLKLAERVQMNLDPNLKKTDAAGQSLPRHDSLEKRPNLSFARRNTPRADRNIR